MTVPTSTSPLCADVLHRVPHDLLIAVEWTPWSSGGTLQVLNSASEDVIAEVANATVADAQCALREAAEAQGDWA